jgi:monothiol glutaredoxin
MTQDMNALIEQLIHEHPVVLFMKGSKSAPLCGYSGYVCQVLQRLSIDFKDVDILSNPELREAIKVYSTWPTLPQLYIRQEFVGGADIVKELYESKQLQKMLDGLSV